MSTPGDGWQALDTFADVLAAEIAAGLLRANGLAARVESFACVPGLQQGVRVRVRSHALALAQALLAQAAVSDEELDALARASPPPP